MRETGGPHNGDRRDRTKGLASSHAARRCNGLVWLATIVAAWPWRAPARRPTTSIPKPVRIMVSFAAGGPTDIVARVMGAKMGELLGQQFVVENKAGAGGNIGADVVAKSPPDGYTLLMATVSTHAINPGPVQEDAVRSDHATSRRSAQVGVTPTLLVVHPSIPATDVKSLIALVKAESGQIHLRLVRPRLDPSSVRRAVQGAGRRPQHRARALSRLGADDGGPGRRPDFDGVRRDADRAAAGRRPARSARSAPAWRQRMRAMPDLPTLQEQGLKGFECYTWNAILAPAGTPQPIVDKLSDGDQQGARRSGGVQAAAGGRRRSDAGPRARRRPPTFIKAELAKWAPIIKASGAQAD